MSTTRIYANPFLKLPDDQLHCLHMQWSICKVTSLDTDFTHLDSDTQHLDRIILHGAGASKQQGSSGTSHPQPLDFILLSRMSVFARYDFFLKRSRWKKYCPSWTCSCAGGHQHKVFQDGIRIYTATAESISTTQTLKRWQSHIAIPNGMPITSLLNCKHLQLQPNKRSIISQSHLHNCFNTVPHRPISTILIVSAITPKNLPINTPKPITYLPNPLQTLSPPTDWVTSVQWTCAPWALNIPVMHRVATTLWP